jgi:hypothetical protein
MLIYKITNLVNQKCYIGLTTRDFNKRYSGGSWWKWTNNKYLKKAASKYGHSNFTVEILEDKISSIKELYEKELFYSLKYNSLAPNGYNLAKCGQRGYARPCQQFYIKRISTGEIIFIDNLIKFCHTNNLNEMTMYSLAHGKSLYAYDFTRPEIDIDQLTYLARNLTTMETVRIFNVRDFCRKNNLSPRSFASMLKGRGVSSQGWTRACISEERLYNNGNSKNYILKDPCGVIREVFNLKSFCKENDLDHCHLYKVYQGLRKSHKGWTKA